MKTITLPDKSLDLVDEHGDKTGQKRNILIHFLMTVIESVPQKSDTESFLAHAIREKCDKYVDGEFTLEDAEIVFIEGGIKSLRDGGKIIGSGWYYLISGLREAK